MRRRATAAGFPSHRPVEHDFPSGAPEILHHHNKANGQVTPPRLFQSFFSAGFECSTHVRRSGLRLDLIKATAHDKFAGQDYLRLGMEGMRVAREGVRWHLVEKRPGQFDFTSVMPIVEAARDTQTQVIWDLCHFGWPDFIDIFTPDFISSLARYGAAFARWLTEQIDSPPFIVPVNEISFLSWAAGDEGSMFPFATRRGLELKSQLVRATIQTMKAIRALVPKARFVQVDPIIHVVADAKHPEEIPDAEAYRLSQYQAWDMVCGRLGPELGGHEDFLDIVGVNFYPHNQWTYNLKDHRRVRKSTPLTRNNPRFRPLRDMLAEVYQRYRRPLLISETGAEDHRRASWFRYVCQESEAAISKGVSLQGICLYPILNHPGWVDNRHCRNGLWDYADSVGNRKIYEPLARELRRWRLIFENEPRVRNRRPNNGSALTNSLV